MAAPATLSGLAPELFPPWDAPAEDGVPSLAVPEVELAADLHGEVVDPDLVVFFAGNQYMLVPELLAAFRRSHPRCGRVYAQTLPPGLLVEQIEHGSLRIGQLRLSLRPDVLTAGRGRIAQLGEERGWFEETLDYARNRLALMVRAGNPRGLRSLADLGEASLRVAMPDPAREGIGRRIETALRQSGGEGLRARVMEEKHAQGSTQLTRIHHRETPLRLMADRADTGPVWYTEARYHAGIARHGLGMVELPEAENVEATYSAARLRDAPHREAATAFVAFLAGDEAQALYRRYGFLPPPP